MAYGKLLPAMEKTTLYLPTELQRALKDAARRSGRPQAELVRDALTQYLAEQPRPMPRSIGMANSGEIPATEVKAWIRAQRDREWQERRQSEPKEPRDHA
jgi:predicted transcriptional regulator